MSPEQINRDLADARERLAALEVEVRTLIQLAEGVKFAAENAILTSERLSDLRHDLERTIKNMTREVDRAVKGCEALSVKLDASQTAKINGRYLLYAALATGSLAILAKILGLA